MNEIKTVRASNGTEPNDACKVLVSLNGQWDWNSLPMFMPLADHEDHYHPMAAFGFPEIGLLAEVVNMFLDDGPFDQMGAPPAKVAALAVVWEQFLRPNGPGDPNVAIGDDVDDVEARLCIVYNVQTGQRSQGIHVRKSDDIGEPVWGGPDVEDGWPLDPEDMSAIERFGTFLHGLEPEDDS